MTLLTDLPVNPASWLDTTEKELFPAVKFNPLLSFYFQENSQNMPYQKEQKPFKNSPDDPCDGRISDLCICMSDHILFSINKNTIYLF